MVSAFKIKHATLILVAHGSRIDDSNLEVLKLTETVKKEAPGLNVQVAFLELAEPSLEWVLEDCAERRVERVFILPFFLSAGKHVGQDLPLLIQKLSGRYPHTRYQLLPHFGALPGIEKLLIHVLIGTLATEAPPKEKDRLHSQESGARDWISMKSTGWAGFNMNSAQVKQALKTFPSLLSPINSAID
mgnify:CR=1 FL=1